MQTGSTMGGASRVYRVTVDNMVRNLTVGRSTNFPSELD